MTALSCPPTQKLLYAQMREIAAELTACDATRGLHAEVAAEWLSDAITGEPTSIEIDPHRNLFYALNVEHPRLHELFAGYATRLDELDRAPQQCESRQYFLDYVCADNPFGSDKPEGIIVLLADHVLAADPVTNKPALKSEAFPTVTDYCRTHSAKPTDILI